MFESPVTFILHTFASNVSPVPYVKLSSLKSNETGMDRKGKGEGNAAQGPP